ncbi:MAG: iron-sulfur cluster assembly scaffold protein, partial [Thermoplasmata archaeon]|nr:iron-sulfur cluster assembly scaffold protein [Thermoplasmata archaeon]
VLFMTDGCGPSIACGSMLTQMVKEKDVWDIEKITNKDLVYALEGLPDENLHCAKLAVDTLKEALRSWDAKDAVDVSKNDKL